MINRTRIFKADFMNVFQITKFNYMHFLLEQRAQHMFKQMCGILIKEFVK